MVVKPGRASGNESARSGLLIAASILSAAGVYFTGEASKGRGLYSANCANCHGANLEGQPGWMIRPCRGKRRGSQPSDPGNW
ncbi:c-type cytochrome [Devosia ureilytica]|uniref:c-type cytochrome n=1 Tax=Devosia ureilytica TaxID=2952754 RepID=UPI0038CD46A9